MSTKILIIIASLVVLVLALLALYKFMPRKLNQAKFEEQWKKIQNLCRKKEEWPKVLLDADRLLMKALKKRRFKGKSMGEKMVSAQRLFTDNDSLWYAHNLQKKIYSGAKPKSKLKESEVKEALIGFRQALRDLGALKSK